jgi:transcriptional regulator GlxA family with amidase domain
LCRHAGLSARTVDRLFRRHLGIGPKVYVQIVRFQRCLARLKSVPTVSLSQIATDGGYYDQSHFVRDYRRFAGTTPVRHKGYYPADAPQDFSPNLVQFVQDPRPT